MKHRVERGPVPLPPGTNCQGFQGFTEHLLVNCVNQDLLRQEPRERESAETAKITNTSTTASWRMTSQEDIQWTRSSYSTTSSIKLRFNLRDDLTLADDVATSVEETHQNGMASLCRQKKPVSAVHCIRNQGSGKTCVATSSTRRRSCNVREEASFLAGSWQQLTTWCRAKWTPNWHYGGRWYGGVCLEAASEHSTRRCLICAEEMPLACFVGSPTDGDLGFGLQVVNTRLGFKVVSPCKALETLHGIT